MRKGNSRRPVPVVDVQIAHPSGDIGGQSGTGGVLAEVGEEVFLEPNHGAVLAFDFVGTVAVRQRRRALLRNHELVSLEKGMSGMAPMSMPGQRSWGKGFDP